MSGQGKKFVHIGLIITGIYNFWKYWKSPGIFNSSWKFNWSSWKFLTGEKQQSNPVIKSLAPVQLFGRWWWWLCIRECKMLKTVYSNGDDVKYKLFAYWSHVLSLKEHWDVCVNSHCVEVTTSVSCHWRTSVASWQTCCKQRWTLSKTELSWQCLQQSSFSCYSELFVESWQF